MSITLVVLAYILCFITTVALFLGHYLPDVLNVTSFYQILFNLNYGVEGSTLDVWIVGIVSYFKSYGLLMLALTLLLVVLIYFLHRYKNRRVNAEANTKINTRAKEPGRRKQNIAGSKLAEPNLTEEMSVQQKHPSQLQSGPPSSLAISDQDDDFDEELDSLLWQIDKPETYKEKRAKTNSKAKPVSDQKTSWFGRLFSHSLLWSCLLFLLSLGLCINGIFYALNQVGYFAYRESIVSGQDGPNLYQRDYVRPDASLLSFPGQKRNVIVLWVESLETALASIENGGDSEVSVIPNIEQLALEGEVFNGKASISSSSSSAFSENVETGETGLSEDESSFGSNTGKSTENTSAASVSSPSSAVGGAKSAINTTWTIAGIIAESAGVPLAYNSGQAQYNWNGETAFMPGLVSLGDLLKEQGYINMLRLGSQVKYAGRANYFLQHGDFILHDYDYAIESGEIPAGYKVWWGYEDQKLFDFARNDLSALSSGNAPFCYMMLTADTHFPKGYNCPQCPDSFDCSMENVFSCSDRQIGEFISWCKEQPFYENTTILITGDHISMDEEIATKHQNYDRKVLSIILNGRPSGSSSSEVQNNNTDLNSLAGSPEGGFEQADLDDSGYFAYSEDVSGDLTDYNGLTDGSDLGQMAEQNESSSLSSSSSSSSLSSSVSSSASLKARQYTTMDLFPTLLAAMGVNIEGDRLGLGTNLYSQRPTLIEEMGLEELDNEIMNSSSFFSEQVMGISETEEPVDTKYNTTGDYDFTQIGLPADFDPAATTRENFLLQLYTMQNSPYANPEMIYQFNDWMDVSPECINALSWGFANNLIGLGSDLNPKKLMSPAEAAIIAERYRMAFLS